MPTAESVIAWGAPIASALVICLGQLWLNGQFKRADQKRDEARMAQAEAERAAREQRDAERAIVLAIARTMLLDNYEKCMDKGYYTVEERDVYSKLYESYKEDKGNGVIDAIAPHIRALPDRPPKDRN